MQYQKIFSLANFPNYVFNSVFVAVVGVILTVTVCSLAGMHLQRWILKEMISCSSFDHDNGRSVRGYYYSVIFDY